MEISTTGQRERANANHSEQEAEMQARNSVAGNARGLASECILISEGQAGLHTAEFDVDAANLTTEKLVYTISDRHYGSP